jgi:O-antigen/teichoic acid export membrane protein
MLTKRLEFRLQMRIGMAANVISGAVAILMAHGGYGIWSLAGQTITATTASTLLVWNLTRWRPAMTFSLKAGRQLFGFGGYLLASSLLDVFYTRLSSLLIGKLYGPRELGFYNRADGTKQLPAGALTGILSRVAFPIFCGAANDAQQLRRGVRLALRGMMLVNVPMMLGLAAVAEPFTVTLFGAQWRATAPILQILCLGGVMWPLHVINLTALIAQGHSDLFLRLEIVKKALGFSLLAVGTMWGVIGIAWSTVAVGLLAFIVNAYYTGRLLNYGAWRQTKDFFPVIGLSAPIAFAVSRFESLLDLQPVLGLCLAVVVGTAAFLAAAKLFRLSAFDDAITLLRVLWQGLVRSREVAI